VTAPARPNTDQTSPERDHRVDGDHGGTFEACGHQQRQQDHAGAGGAADQHAIADGAGGETGVADPDLSAAEHATQRHAQDQHCVDHQGCARIGQACVAIGAERGRQRRAFASLPTTAQ
jgi:hypothetical protein